MEFKFTWFAAAKRISSRICDGGVHLQHCSLWYTTPYILYSLRVSRSSDTIPPSLPPSSLLSSRIRGESVLPQTYILKLVHTVSLALLAAIERTNGPYEQRCECLTCTDCGTFERSPIRTYLSRGGFSHPVRGNGNNTRVTSRTQPCPRTRPSWGPS